MTPIHEIEASIEAEKRYIDSPSVDALIRELGEHTRSFWEPGARALISSYLSGVEDVSKERGVSILPETHIGDWKSKALSIARFSRDNPNETSINARALARESRELRHAMQGPFRTIDGKIIYVAPRGIYYKSGREEAYHRLQHYGWPGTLPMDGHTRYEIERDAKQAAGWNGYEINRNGSFESYLEHGYASYAPGDALDLGDIPYFDGDGTLW